MPFDPHIRKIAELRKGRFDNAGARYFLTLCVSERSRVLHDERAESVAREIAAMNDESVIGDYALVVMPDHLHWLFILGNKLGLGQVVGRLKAKTRRTLSEVGASWQPDYYERRLRSDECSERYAAYMFLNPYRAGLIPCSRRWPHWYAHKSGLWEFESCLDNRGCPPERWMKSVGNPIPPG